MQRFAGTRPAKMIRREGGEPLFVRYFLCKLPGGGQLYLHHYLAPDDDCGPHDHPWLWAASLVLAGGYTEYRVSGYRECVTAAGQQAIYDGRFIERKPGRIYRMTGQDFHRIAAMRDGRTSSWSLFVHGPYRKTWGFWLFDSQGLRFREGHSSKDVAARQWWKTAPKGRVFHAA